MFSETQLVDLYNLTKHDISYFKKYEAMPSCPVKRYGYNWGHYDYPRNCCILDFIEWTTKYSINTGGKLGYTSETDPELEFLNYKESTFTPYPAYDLHTISNSFKDEFDFFLFSQTLEHLYNPFAAVADIYKIVKPGGYVFTSVPTLNIPHMTPIHFGGFTPMGLSVMFKSAGFEILETGQWGNIEYITKLFATHKWPGYNDMRSSGIIKNEERNACQCWILVRKPI